LTVIKDQKQNATAATARTIIAVRTMTSDRRPDGFPGAEGCSCEGIV
jgi:hypothetical protein